MFLKSFIIRNNTYFNKNLPWLPWKRAYKRAFNDKSFPNESYMAFHSCYNFSIIKQNT